MSLNKINQTNLSFYALVCAQARYNSILSVTIIAHKRTDIHSSYLQCKSDRMSKLSNANFIKKKVVQIGDSFFSNLLKKVLFMPNSTKTKQRRDRIAIKTFVGDYKNRNIFGVYYLFVQLTLKDNCNYCFIFRYSHMCDH